MKISMNLMKAFILITLFHSCTVDDLVMESISDTDETWTASSSVSTSYISCPININYTADQAYRVRLDLAPCDAPTDLVYELDYDASQYFEIDSELNQLVAKERLLSAERRSVENYGVVNVYEGEQLIEKRTITVNAIAVPKPPNDDLIAYYPLDGDGIDMTGYANHAKPVNAVPTRGSNNAPNSAMKLDGQDGTIFARHQDHLNLTKAFTISAWVKLEERKTQSVVQKGSIINGPNSMPFSLALSETGDIVFAMKTKQDVRYEARKIGYPLCEWVHLAAIYDGEEMYLYENGILVQSAQGPPIANTNKEPLLMGTRLRLRSDTLNGAIDEVRIYDRALSAQEVIDLSVQNLN